MFRRKPNAGLSVTDECLKLSIVRKRGQKIVLATHRTETLPEGVIKDGKILDESKLLQSIKKLVHDLKHKHIHLTLPNALTMIRFMNFPNVPIKSLRKLIRFEVEHQMFFPFSDPEFNYIIQPINHSMSYEQDERQVMLIAASKSVLNQYVSLFERAKLRVASIELDAMSLFRLLAHVEGEISDTTLMTINVMNEQTDISVYKDSYIKITRSVPLDFSIQTSTSYNHEYSQLVGEIERIISFYTYSMNHREEKIKKIYVFGDVANLDDIIEFIRQHIQIEVVSMNHKPIVIKHARKKHHDVEDAHIGVAWSYAVSMGLSLKGAK